MSVRNVKYANKSLIKKDEEVSDEAQHYENPPKAANDEETAEASSSSSKRTGRLALMLIVPLALVVGGGWFWLTGGRFEETDNAYAQQAQVAISSDVSGRILSVDVEESQRVSAGDVLFKLDSEPFQIAVDQAEASLGKIRLDVEQLKVNYQTATAMRDASRETLKVQQELYDRRAILAKKGVTSNNSLDELKLSLLQAKSAVTSAEKTVDKARAALAGNPKIATDDHPLVRQANAALKLAKRNLAKATVKAPHDGIVNHIDELNTGQYIDAGTAVASLFEVNKTWVDANFKETQLENIRIGMPVDVTFDAYPGTHFKGRVASISSGTGAEFSLIPAQNATGNWVKVVQRVPVRIEPENDSFSDRLRSGMSAVVSIDTGKTTLNRL
ncbi:membrane fusion protein, multidrug efflux system [Cohaesibacter sp. ES.047]|uniref:HlyD family secretion protein n=1 Tax=Cohaesibacter sp. ES.047 TaxID=1798205 RepID=UPI000BB6B6D6|nr:HlyD family secretion protein [Cohaesibacter sp. ES.047]SNY90722.1 membrane fusion protein, multidrug efflux system [Cohaesibacter sp. ES.047]